MDNQTYLDQISASNRPAKKAGGISNFLSSILGKVIIGGVVAFIAIMILGNILSGNKGSLKDRTIKLSLHLSNVSTVIDTYRPFVKSSDLRSASVTLSTILAATSSAVTNNLNSEEKFDPKKVDKKITEEEENLRVELDTELFEAKINGLLDRTYARKIAYEISIIMSREADIIKSTKDDTLKTELTNSYNNLDTLYDSFDSFSEAKK